MFSQSLWEPMTIPTRLFFMRMTSSFCQKGAPAIYKLFTLKSNQRRHVITHHNDTRVITTIFNRHVRASLITMPIYEDIFKSVVTAFILVATPPKPSLERAGTHGSSNDRLPAFTASR